MKIHVEFDSIEEFQKYFNLTSTVNQTVNPVLQIQPASTPMTPPQTKKRGNSSVLRPLGDHEELEKFLDHLYSKYQDNTISSSQVVQEIKEGQFFASRFKGDYPEGRALPSMFGRIISSYLRRIVDGYHTRYTVALNQQSAKSKFGKPTTERTYTISLNTNGKIKLPTLKPHATKPSTILRKEWLEVLNLFLEEGKPFKLESIISNEGMAPERFAFMRFLENHTRLLKQDDYYCPVRNEVSA